MSHQRNLSVNALFQRLAKEHKPQYRFAGSSAGDWQQWQEQLLPKVKATLGKLPAKVPLNPQTILQWEEDGLIKQKVVFEVEAGLSATAYVFRPANCQGQVPGILACHGHGPHGKETVMGNSTSAALQANIQLHNYDYGLQLAKAGYAVIAIDWRGFGERDDRNKPHCNDTIHGRDICNVHFLRETILGRTLLGSDVHDGMCALDYLCQQSFVDPNKIGVMGLSFGGTMTTWMALCDERIKAADIICYSDLFAQFGMRDNNFCGSQITPGLYSLCDLPDLQGLIAPRPLLVEIGIHDDCFRVESAKSCFDQVKKIYAAAGQSDQLELDLFEGGHQWSGKKTFAFFKKHLG